MMIIGFGFGVLFTTAAWWFIIEATRAHVREVHSDRDLWRSRVRDRDSRLIELERQATEHMAACHAAEVDR